MLTLWSNMATSWGIPPDLVGHYYEITIELPLNYDDIGIKSPLNHHWITIESPLRLQSNITINHYEITIKKPSPSPKLTPMSGGSACLLSGLRQPPCAQQARLLAPGPLLGRLHTRGSQIWYPPWRGRSMEHHPKITYIYLYILYACKAFICSGKKT